MRIQARLLLGMFGLALAIPAAAAAAPSGDGDASLRGDRRPAKLLSQHPTITRGSSDRRHCVECQRAYVKAHDGVDVPAPPPMEPGAMMHGHDDGRAGGLVPDLPGNAVMSGPVHDGRRSRPRLRRGRRPGAMASTDAPGYAVVGGEAGPVGGDPTPIGVSRSGQAAYSDPRMAAMGPRPGVRTL